MVVLRRILLTVIFTLILSTINNIASCKTISAKKLGMVPSDVTYASYNASKLVEAFNSGYKVRINNQYFIGEADIYAQRDICLKGSGGLCIVSSQCINVVSPISISIKGITFSTTKKVDSDSQVKFISNVGHNYHNLLRVEKCHISGVRIYTHVADDVDQNTIKDCVNIF